MRTGITDIEQAVESLMEHVYVDGHQTDFTVQTIEANPPMRGDDSVALYMGGRTFLEYRRSTVHGRAGGVADVPYHRGRTQ